MNKYALHVMAALAGFAMVKAFGIFGLAMVVAVVFWWGYGRV